MVLLNFEKLSYMEKIKWTFTRKEKETENVCKCLSGLEAAPTWMLDFPEPVRYHWATQTQCFGESLQNWSASLCALSDQSYAILPNVRSYVQEKYSQGRNGEFPDMVSPPRMTPLTLPHVWLPFVGELLDFLYIKHKLAQFPIKYNNIYVHI